MFHRRAFSWVAARRVELQAWPALCLRRGGALAWVVLSHQAAHFLGYSLCIAISVHLGFRVVDGQVHLVVALHDPSVEALVQSPLLLASTCRDPLPQRVCRRVEVYRDFLVRWHGGLQGLVQQVEPH